MVQPSDRQGLDMELHVHRHIIGTDSPALLAFHRPPLLGVGVVGSITTSVRGMTPGGRRAVPGTTESQSAGAGVGTSAAGKDRCACGNDNGDRLLSTREAADFMGVSKEYLEKIRTYGMKRGEPPKFARIGRRVLYRRSELEAFIDRRSAQTTSEYDPGG